MTIGTEIRQIVILSIEIIVSDIDIFLIKWRWRPKGRSTDENNYGVYYNKQKKVPPVPLLALYS